MNLDEKFNFFYFINWAKIKVLAACLSVYLTIYLSHTHILDHLFYFPPERIELVVQEVPAAPSDLRLESRSSKQVIISWHEPFNGHAEIVDYLVQLKNISGEDEISKF